MNCYNFRPDWDMFGTAAELEAELSDFKFHGPGWYKAKTGETLLLLPDGEQEKPFASVKHWEDGQRFRAFVFSENPGPVFSAIASAPVRVDEEGNIWR